RSEARSALRANPCRPRGFGTARSDSSSGRQRAASTTLQSPHPKGACTPTPGRVPQKPFCCQQIGLEGTMRPSRSKVGGRRLRVRIPAGRGHIERNLLTQSVDARELPLLSQAPKEGKDEPFVVKIA